LPTKPKSASVQEAGGSCGVRKLHGGISMLRLRGAEFAALCGVTRST